MADEDKNPENLDPENEPSPNEDGEPQEPKAPEEEPGKEPEAEEPEEEFDEPKYLEEYDLPGKPQTVDDALAAYKQLAAAKTISEIKKEEPPEKREPVKAEGDELSETPFVDFVGKMKFKDEDNRQAYESLAQSIDGAYTPRFKAVDQRMKTFIGIAELLVGHVREQSWQSFEHKGRVDRKKLNATMDEFGLLNYSDALRQLAIKGGDPNLLKLLVPSSDDGKRGSRFTSLRRGKKSKVGRSLAADYLTPDGELDREKLGKLPSEQALKIVQAHTKELQEKSGVT